MSIFRDMRGNDNLCYLPLNSLLTQKLLRKIQQWQFIQPHHEIKSHYTSTSHEEAHEMEIQSTIVSCLLSTRVFDYDIHQEIISLE